MFTIPLVILLQVFVSNVLTFEFIYKPGPLIPATTGEIWPQVQSEDKLNEGYYSVLTSFFHFEITGASCSILQKAVDRYRKIIVFHSRHVQNIYYEPKSCDEQGDINFLGYLSSIQIELKNPCADDDFPALGMNEEYTLNITASIKTLQANTIWGILRGLETFSQLIFLSDDQSCHRIGTTSIHDFPRFPHRGFLLDTSRHYYSEANILNTLDSMSYNKYNVFHWHIVDDYSFPYVSKKFPELSAKGAFHPKLMLYEQSFVSQVIEYARMRGIRVIAEFDTPGHTLSWGLGNPDLLTKCYDVDRLEWGPTDPTKDSTYLFMYDLLEEIQQVFPDQYTHLGGDEVDTACWKSNPEILQFMSENGMEDDFVALQSYYTQKIITHTERLNLRSIVWEEVFTNGVQLPNSTVVHVWIPETVIETTENAVKDGHPVIISAYWYLNLFDPNGTGGTGGDWLRFYNDDPHNFDVSDEEKSLILGGEACMWSEVANENNFESRIWPRGSVPAEKFWSAPGPSKILTYLDIEDVWPIAARLEEQTCRMKRRGIKAQPPTGPSVCF